MSEMKIDRGREADRRYHRPKPKKSNSQIITELLDRTCRTGHDDEVMNRAAAEIESLSNQVAEYEAALLDADNLVKVIDQQIRLRQIDARSPIADARLDYERLAPNQIAAMGENDG